MTTQNLHLYYAELLILQYIGKPKAYATIQTLCDPVVMDKLPITVQNSYDITTASGVQLDVLGKYVGAFRETFDFSGPVTLTDAEFRILIQIKIVQNNSYSSLADIQNLLHTYFPGVIRVFDGANMHMDYFFDSTFGTERLAEVFVKQGLLPKPMGVQLGALVYAASITNFFGMFDSSFGVLDPSTYGAKGFGDPSSYDTSEIWLENSQALVP